ncbi:hypothetical protein ACVILH_001191 [Bradyrhizobium sp. USDA 4353]
MRRVSNHEAPIQASPFETPAYGGLLRARGGSAAVRTVLGDAGRSTRSKNFYCQKSEIMLYSLHPVLMQRGVRVVTIR